MDNYDLEQIERKIFDIIRLKTKENLDNSEKLSFKFDDLTNELQTEPNILHDNMIDICKKLLKRDIEINNDDGSWIKFSIFISVKYENGIGLKLELNPEIRFYKQYL